MAFDHVLYYTGALTGAYVIRNAVSFFYPYLRPSSLHRYLRDHQGQKSWALITGASDGIGLGFAQELCAHGFNVILHGRNAEKLSGVRARLAAEYPKVEIRTIIADAASPTLSSIDDIVASLQDVYLTVLINNVGGTHGLDPDWKTVEAHTGKEVDNVINTNLRFATHLTRALLPTLERNEPSLILNTGSLAETGIPWVSVYSATKAYMNAFTNALGLELKGLKRDIEVLGITAGSVKSGQNAGKPSLMVPDGLTMARAALAKVGCGRANVRAYLPHALQFAALDALPVSLSNTILISIAKDLADRKAKEW